MNCEELVRKMNNKDNDLDILNELLFENESNTLEMLEATDDFLKKLLAPKIEDQSLEQELDLQLQNDSLKQEIQNLKSQITTNLRPSSVQPTLLDEIGGIRHHNTSYGSQSPDLAFQLKTLEKEIDQLTYENHLLRSSTSGPELEKKFLTLKDEHEQTQHMYQRLIKSAQNFQNAL